jgi:glutathione S-transferase
LRVGHGARAPHAHLTWSLLLLGRAGVDIAQWPSLVGYLERMRARPQVKAAIKHEMELYKTMQA